MWLTALPLIIMCFLSSNSRDICWWHMIHFKVFFSVPRLKMKPDVVLRRLAIAVASNDHSYMPQFVSVAVGKNRRSLQEIRDIRIPSNVTGYVALLENANITHPCESPPVSLSAQLSGYLFWACVSFCWCFRRKLFFLILHPSSEDKACCQLQMS